MVSLDSMKSVVNIFIIFFSIFIVFSCNDNENIRPSNQESVLQLRCDPIPIVRIGFIGLGQRGSEAVKRYTYLDDVNNPEDIAYPTLKFFDTVYYVNSIDEITYDHLEVEDDKPGVTVTHKVYHEVNAETGKDQYWIQYTATDAVGKSVSKVQKIEFNERPSEEEVYDFAELER